MEPWVELTIAPLFSRKRTLHEAPLHPRAKGPSTRGSLLLLLGFWGLWVLPCRSSPTLGSRHSGGSCPLLSAHSVSWHGFWTGPWRRFSSLHTPYRASPPSDAPRSLCLPQTCSWAPPAPPLWWSHFETSAAVQGCISLESWHWQSWTRSPLCLKYNTNQYIERRAREAWMSNWGQDWPHERGH